MIKLDNKYKKLLLFGFFVILVVSGVKVVDKALEDRTAFLRWSQDAETLSAGNTVYDRKDEGYPNLPLMLLILMPFYQLGPVAGSIAWLLFKFGIIVFVFWAVVRVARNNGPPFPDWALLVILLLSMRVFISDLTHANVNLVIGGLVVLAMFLNFNEKDFLSGMSIGLAAVLKVTPALFIPYFLYKRKWMGFAGSIAGIFLFIWIIPGTVLGFEFNNRLIMEWYNQMVHPFVTGMPVDLMQTEHKNQSFTGLFYRLLSDSVAIAADPRHGYEALKINIVSLSQDTVSIIVKFASLVMVGALAFFCRTPRSRPRHLGNLGEFALVFLAMLFLSERSWKHHYVLIILAHAFVLYYLLVMNPNGWKKWMPLVFMVVSIFLHTFTSSMFLGRYASDLLEAYGVFVIGALFLFGACAAALRALRLEGWPDRYGNIEGGNQN